MINKQSNSLTNHSITRSLNHSIIQSFNHSIIQSLDHSIIQSLDHSIIQSFNHSIIQSFNHSITQSFNHSIIQSIIQSLDHSIIQSLDHSIIQSLDYSINHSIKSNQRLLHQAAKTPFLFMINHLCSLKISYLSPCSFLLFFFSLLLIQFSSYFFHFLCDTSNHFTSNTHAICQNYSKSNNLIRLPGSSYKNINKATNLFPSALFRKHLLFTFWFWLKIMKCNPIKS